VGLVIGKGGATVKWMSQESGAQIQVVDGNTPGLANLKRLGMTWSDFRDFRVARVAPRSFRNGCLKIMPLEN